MGLKFFHLFFISISSLMFFWLGLWRGRLGLDEGSALMLVQAAACCAVGAGLVVYGVRFMKKQRDVGYL